MGDKMKKVLSIFKRIIISGFILYGYNMIAVSYGSIIPINLITLSSVSVLGFPALFSLILIQKLIF